MSDPLPARFQEMFGAVPLYRAAAPGRVNLIGEHTDYNGGYVMPMALDRRTIVLCRPRTDRSVTLHSMEYGETVAFDLDRIERSERPLWANYPKGVARVLRDEGFALRGMDGLIAGSVPLGAGLSSSAAIEVATALAFAACGGFEIDTMCLTRLCQRAENEFVGMRCGIMDQFIAVHGRRGYAVMLDCTTMEFEAVPLDSERTRVVLCDTGVRHELAATAYNERRAQCEEAIRMIRDVCSDVRNFHDLDPDRFALVRGSLPEPLLRRARHVVGENARVLASAAALGDGRLDEFGRLMNASHESLRDDYEVSCEELDLMVELARETPGTLGARMTGGGFGGCTVNLVRPEAVEEFAARVSAGYEARTGGRPAVYAVSAGAGAGVEEIGG